MRGSISRRSLVAGAGYVMAGSAGQMLAAVSRAQDAPPAQTGASLCMSMLFINAAKSKFDSARYVQKHLPLLRELYGDSVERIELRTSAGSAMGVPPPLLATATLWIRDVQAFSQKLGTHADRINKDLDASARGNRMVQVDRLVLERGEERGAVPSNSHVFSMFFPAATPGAMRPGAAPAEPTFDARYFTEAYLPRLYSLFGANSVRRLEATLGMDQGDRKAAHLGAYHLYIRDRSEFDSKSGSVFTDMQKDAGKFTTIFPMLADMRLNAIA